MSSCAHPEALVETAWVAEHASDPNVRVFAVDADTAAWEQGHIPGAVCLSWKADLQQQSVRDVVSTEQLEALLSEHGVTADTTIVVYGEARLAASFFWLLVSHGHKDIRLLNGGRVQWVAEGRPLATKVPSYGPARYVAGQRDVSVRALRDDVLDAIGAEVPIETGGPAVPRSNAVRRALALSLVFFVVYLAVFSGMRQAEARFVEHARLLGARPLDIVREVYVPSILGWLFASLRLALGFAFSGAVIGELLGSSRGLGYLVNAASGRFDPAGILAVVFVILLIIGLAFAALSSVERRTLRWRASETASVG